MIKKLASCIGKYKIFVILTPLTVLFEVILEVAIPKLMSLLIDNGLQKGNISYVIETGLMMVAMALLSMFFGAICGRFASVASTGFGANVRRRLFHKIQDFSFANTDKFSTASLVTRLTTDITFVQMSLMIITRMMVRAPAMLAMGTVMAFSINSDISLIFLIAIPVLGTALFFIIRKAYPLFVKMFGQYDAMNASVQENLTGIRVVKAFVRQDYENGRFVDSATALMNAQKRAEKIVILNMPIMQLVMYACMIAISWFGGNKIVSGSMTTGDLMALISYVTQILISLMMISMGMVTLTISRASAQRITEVFDEKLDITDDDADENLQVKDGSICFDGVSFSYSGNPDNLTLHDINLSISPGERVGIIGGTGSAKTTLVQLLPRLYDIYGGSLTVGGHSVRDYKLRTLRDSVAMVLQKNILFSGTIRENLKWGNENATDEELEAACRIAQAHDFITSFPNGYDTDLGQGGVNVSGGQKQRLCIARALLKNPKILILDDSTSAVDTATDRRIRDAFSEYRSDITVIIIAQRIASVMDADKIVVMDEGGIAAVGKHEELLKTCEIYREVYTSQTEDE